VRPQRLRQPSDDAAHEVLVVPSALLPDKADIRRARGGQGAHPPCQERPLVPDNNLGRGRLQIRPVAHQRDMGKVTPSPALADVLHRFVARALLRDKDIALLATLEDAHSSLAQVDPKNCLAVRDLPLAEVPPLPHGAGLIGM
jgi:hypothetical protein